MIRSKNKNSSRDGAWGQITNGVSITEVKLLLEDLDVALARPPASLNESLENSELFTLFVNSKVSKIKYCYKMYKNGKYSDHWEWVRINFLHVLS